MNSSSPSPSSAVPSIHIHVAEDPSALFEGDIFSDMSRYLEDTIHACSRDLQPDYTSPNHTVTPSELEEISELSHLSTTNPLFLTGHGYSLPFPIVQESACSDLGPSPSSPFAPSPTPSFGSLSPSSFYDPLVVSDVESPLSPIPVSPLWPYEHHARSSDSLVSPTFFDPLAFDKSHASIGPIRPRAGSSPPRPGPVASKAMLEANGRRRRHPAQFQCTECEQTFTALFSLRRHLQSHTGERPFACSISGCSQRFYNSSDCKRHEKSKKRHKDLLMP